MKYLAAILLSGLLAANGVLIVVTASSLPARVASNFNFQGYANGYMARGDYLILMAAVGLGVPILMLFVTVLLPYLVPSRLLHIPSRDYWTAPDRRSETLSTVATLGLFTSCLMAAFMIAIHLLVIEANSRTPPRMDTGLLFVFIAVLVLTIPFSQFVLWRRFQVPR